MFYGTSKIEDSRSCINYNGIFILTMAHHFPNQESLTERWLCVKFRATHITIIYYRR